MWPGAPHRSRPHPVRPEDRDPAVAPRHRHPQSPSPAPAPALQHPGGGTTPHPQSTAGACTRPLLSDPGGGGGSWALARAQPPTHPILPPPMEGGGSMPSAQSHTSRAELTGKSLPAAGKAWDLRKLHSAPLPTELQSNSRT